MEVIQEMGRSYLCVEDRSESRHAYMRNMLINNVIKGQPLCRKGIFENKDVLKYDITNMKNIKREYENKSMHFEDLKWLLYGIAEQLSIGNTFLLDEEYYVFDPEYIYIDMESGRLNMICIPYKCLENSDDEKYHSLSDFILEKIEHKEEHAVSIAYQFYRMSKEKLFSMIGFCSLIDKEQTNTIAMLNNNRKTSHFLYEDNDKSATEEDKAIKSNDFMCAEANTEKEKTGLSEAKETSKKKKAADIGIPSAILVIGLLVIFRYVFVDSENIYRIQIISISTLILLLSIAALIIRVRNYFKEKEELEIENKLNGRKITVKEYWGGDEETVFFDEKTQFFDTEESKKYSVEWNENGEEKKEIVSDGTVILGKKFDEVDVCILDPTVSRKHAKMTIKSGSVYLRDLGSTNGTYVDGKKIAPGEDIKLYNNQDFLLGKVAVRVV